jgi:hypothetical protein
MREHMTDVEYEGFEAYREHMRKQFRVHGRVLVKNGGYRVSLDRVSPQGINPDDLILKLVFQPDFEPASEQVEFHEGWRDGEPPTYTTVTFQVEGPETLEGMEPPRSLTVTDVY